MTSEQPLLEMARHRHAAIAHFEKFDTKDYSIEDPSSQEQRELEAQMLNDFKIRFRPFVIKKLAANYSAKEKYALEHEPHTPLVTKLLCQIE